MKNNFLIFFFIFFFSKAFALENLNITAKKISIDKDKEITIFQDNVMIVDEENNTIKGDYVLYNNKLKQLNFKGKVTVLTSEGYMLKAKICF